MAMEGESIETTSGGVSTKADTATIEIKIKTLDSQTYTLRVNKCVPVPQLKEQIAGVTGIESGQQRLICRGQVLRDSELLSHYHVEDGHTLHLVVRQPPESVSNNAGASNVSPGALNSQSNPGAESIVLEAINIQHRSRGFPNIGQIVSSIINSLGASGLASLGMDPVSGAANNEPRAAESTEPHLNPRSFTVEIGSMRVPSQTQSTEPSSGSASSIPVPDSLTTISQYLEFMTEEFRRAGFFGHIDSFTPVGRGSGTQSVSNLAQALVSTRSLMTQAQICLSELAAQLSDHANVTPIPARAQLQALSVRSGILMQNLGSLLLELGRNAIMLHTGPTPQDAWVNGGPAMFISGSGPNPLMVQPVPFFPSSSLAGHNGDLHSTRGVHSDISRSVRRPRNIDIHIRAGRATPAPSVNPSGETGTQTQEQPGAARNSGTATRGLNGEPGVRMVPLPLRMVAVPVVARIPVRGDSGGVASPATDPTNGRSQPNSDHFMQGQNFDIPSEPSLFAPGGYSDTESVDIASLLQDWLGNANVVDPLQVRASGTTRQEPRINVPSAAPPHSTGDTRIPEATSGVSEEGIQFSNLLRQVLPVVSPIVDATSNASPGQNSVDGSNDHARRNSNVSRSLNNPEEGPSAKRQRKND